jgi:hypothetical protein
MQAASILRPRKDARTASGGDPCGVVLELKFPARIFRAASSRTRNCSCPAGTLPSRNSECSPANTLASLLASNFPEAGLSERQALMYAALVLLAITLIVNVIGTLILVWTSRNMAKT